MSQFKTKSAEACTIENQEVCESYCKGESFGVQDLLNATETMQFPWSGRCSGGLWQYQVIYVCIRISVVTKLPRSTAKSINDIVESALPNTSAASKKHNISDRCTRAAIVPPTSTNQQISYIHSIAYPSSSKNKSGLGSRIIVKTWEKIKILLLWTCHYKIAKQN